MLYPGVSWARGAYPERARGAVKSWDDSLAVGYLVTVAAPFLDQIAVLARQAVAADQTGADRAVCDGQAREVLAHVRPFPPR
jgi:hypothetical protein